MIIDDLLLIIFAEQKPRLKDRAFYVCPVCRKL